MASWKAIQAAEPAFTSRVQELFDAGRHKTIATVRKDGAPRISGIEATFVLGELWFGSILHAVKALDLSRDPRFALHGPTGEVDPATWRGDAKISGRVEEITDPTRVAEVTAAEGGEQPPEPSHLYRAEISEVVLTQLGEPADHLVIEAWSERHGLRRIERQ
ncbi:MAG: Pyridoxamine 5'-phosphate oxidase-related FMN-binding protein [Chloroflexi bacterium]|nr:Pyridoxamine 5'-phosphate oxidase-related FMN-binding protein [Chloroflexota bacterium]